MTRPATLMVVVTLALGGAGCPPPSSSAPTRLATGTTPNAVEAITCSDGPRLLVTASAEARLDILDPAGLAPPRSVFLGAGSAPWDVAVWRHAGDLADGDAIDEQARAVVTLSGTHAVALVAPCGPEPTLIHTVRDEAPFALPGPVALRDPEDVDGDGVAEVEVTQMQPRSPQGVVVAADRIFVAFANILAFATGPEAPMLTGPGLVGRFDVDDDGAGHRLRPSGRALLPCDNAAGLAVVDDDALAVTCAGRYAVAPGGHGKASPGALALVDTATMAAGAAAAASTPGPLLVADDDLVTGDLLDGALLRSSLPALSPVETRPGRADVVDSAFALVVDPDGAVVAGWFDGRVMWDPFGAARTTPGPDGPPRGLVDLVSDGERLWGLHTLSAELVVIPEAP